MFFFIYLSLIISDDLKLLRKTGYTDHEINLVTTFNFLVEFSRIISSYTVDGAYAHGGLQKRDKIIKIFGADVFFLHREV
jgi:hypothetical protein